MLHRSSSSRRRRASRSAASSPQARSPRSPSHGSRRASLVTTEAEDDPEPIRQRSPRPSLAPDAALEISRSPRHSLVPETRSARNSIVPETALSPRNTLAPNRNTLAPESSYGSRLSLNPQDFNRSPRNSLVPDPSARSPRRSLVPENTFYQQRNSLVPDVGRSPRHSVASIQLDPSRSQRELGPSPKTSPRGSFAGDSCRAKSKDPIFEINRSPRGSLAGERSPRGSIAPSIKGGLMSADDGSSSRISPRGSLTLTFQEPLTSRERRSSEDSTVHGKGGRSTSPYRGTGTGGGSGRGTQINYGFTGSTFSESGSRRASSSVSQVSGDEQRRLCSEQSKFGCESGVSHGLGVGLTTYGSVGYQLKDANMEASGTLDFVCRAVRIINRTVLMTVLLACLTTLPVIMLIMGVQFIRDCPAEPRIPVYMVVGGAAGGTRLIWLLWAQFARRGISSAVSAPERVLAWLLSAFLLAWFALGNYWTLGIMWPDYAPTLFEPNKWCHRTLYVFALVQLGLIWGLIALAVFLAIVLVLCQVFGCGWLGPPRYK